MSLHLALEDALHTFRQKRQINMSLAKDGKKGWEWVFLTVI